MKEEGDRGRWGHRQGQTWEWDRGRDTKRQAHRYEQRQLETPKQGKKDRDTRQEQRTSHPDKERDTHTHIECQREEKTRAMGRQGNKSHSNDADGPGHPHTVSHVSGGSILHPLPAQVRAAGTHLPQPGLVTSVTSS